MNRREKVELEFAEAQKHIRSLEQQFSAKEDTLSHVQQQLMRQRLQTEQAEKACAEGVETAIRLHREVDTTRMSVKEMETQLGTCSKELRQQRSLKENADFEVQQLKKAEAAMQAELSTGRTLIKGWEIRLKSCTDELECQQRLTKAAELETCIQSEALSACKQELAVARERMKETEVVQSVQANELEAKAKALQQAISRAEHAEEEVSNQIRSLSKLGADVVFERARIEDLQSQHRSIYEEMATLRAKNEEQGAASAKEKDDLMNERKQEMDAHHDEIAALQVLNSATQKEVELASASIGYLQSQASSLEESLAHLHTRFVEGEARAQVRSCYHHNGRS